MQCAHHQKVECTEPHVFEMDFGGIDFGTSAILNDSGKEVDTTNGSVFINRSPPTSDPSFSLPNLTNTYSTHASTNEKQIKTSSGKVITLRKRKNASTEVLDNINLTNIDNFVDIDSLFKKVELRRSLKNAPDLPTKPSKTKSTSLWTEKYRPKSFMQLCSTGNDKQYRTVMNWLKQWSSLVHKEPLPVTETKELNYSQPPDPHGRPFKKIMLIHGPPGIGKTVAAHIFARQANYEVQEINAANSLDVQQSLNSENSGFKGTYASLKLKITNALTSNSVLGDGKPTCIVIDEIDTCPNSNEIIRVLFDLTRTDRLAVKSLKGILIQRPIICIASSTYSTRLGNNMDKLRDISEQVAFKKPAITVGSGKKPGGNAVKSIKEHLMHVSKQERLDLDFRTISDIVEICEADIRACLNYMQFNSRKLIVPVIENKANGPNKDSEISWFALVNILFKKNSRVSNEENFRYLFDLLMNGGGASALSTTGSFDKVLKGCFSRYLDVIHFQSDTLDGAADLSDWVSFYDRRGFMNTEVDYLAPLICLKIWSLFSCLDPNLNPTNELIPKSRSIDFESYEAMKANELLLASIVDHLPASLSHALGVSKGGKEIIAGTFLPLLDKMFMAEQITAGTKSRLSLSPSEKECLEKVASLVKNMDIRLETHKSVDSNQILLKMNPSWDSIVQFESKNLGKQGLVQVKRKILFPLVSAQLEEGKITKIVAKRVVQGKEESIKKRQKSEKIDEFFKSPQKKQDIQKNAETHESTRIWVKYNEGFSNAVRKNITWADFWRPGAL